jgi:hypothetical protein
VSLPGEAVKKLALVPLAGLAAIAAFCIWRAIDASGDPGRFYRHRNGPEGFAYPTGSVTTWCALIAGELAMIGWLVARARKLARTCALLAVVLGVAFFATAIFGMHAPPYFTSFVVAQLFAGAWLLLSAPITAILERVLLPTTTAKD